MAYVMTQQVARGKRTRIVGYGEEHCCVGFGSCGPHPRSLTLRCNISSLTCATFSWVMPETVADVLWSWKRRFRNPFAQVRSVLAKFEEVAERKIYNANCYFMSGHYSLEHLYLALVPVLFSFMLMYQKMTVQRLADHKERM